MTGKRHQGTEVEVRLPGDDVPVKARVVRCHSGILAVSFRQDVATLARVSRALTAVSQLRAGAA